MDLSMCIPIFFKSDRNILNINCFSERDKLNWKYEINLLKKIYQYREKLSFLNYETILEDFIIINEGFRLYPYFCSAGVPTIGTGLALTEKNSLKFNNMAIEAFRFIGRNIFDLNPIDDLINKKIEIITESEGRQLLRFILETMRDGIIKELPFFYQLPLNIKVTVESLYYNSPIFIKNHFAESLELFCKTRDEKYLYDVLWRICRNCNRGAPYENKASSNLAWKGLQYRRYREMIMCSNLKIDVKFFKNMHDFFSFK